MRVLVMLLLAVLAGSEPGWAQTAPPTREQVEAVVAAFPEFSGVVMVAIGGQPSFVRAYGEADREWGIANTRDTRFRIGSMTKAFTAAAILQLQDQGKLSLEDPISKFIPDTPPTWSAITLQHLLNHTSGLARGLPKQGDIIRQDITPNAMVDLMRTQPLAFATGARMAYSNNGYVLLGKVVETVSGKTYSDYVRDNIMMKTSMAASGYDVTASIIPHRADGYTVREARFVNASFVAMTLPYAAGGLISTVDDLLRWDQALYDDTILSPASRAAMFRDYGSAYGLGWEIRTKFGHRNVSHGGGINGFSCWMERYQDDRLTVIVLSNIETTRSDILANNLSALYLGQGPRKAFSGAETAIRRVTEGLRKGEIVADVLTAQGIAALEAQLPQHKANLARLGELESVKLLGVDAGGTERYRMTYRNGVRDWIVQFDLLGRLIPMGAIDVPLSDLR